MATFRYPIAPNPKVRMTRKDTWARDKVRPAVLRWRLFRDAIQAAGVTILDGDNIVFRVPMPESWPKKKKEKLAGTPCQAKPDLDNLLGGLFDAAMPKGDQHIHTLGHVSKRWAYEGSIEIFRDEGLAETLNQ